MKENKSLFRLPQSPLWESKGSSLGDGRHRYVPKGGREEGGVSTVGRGASCPGVDRGGGDG